MGLEIHFISILVLIYLNSFIECKSSALYCTHKTRDYDVNKLTSIFTIGDKVYLRVGSKVSKLWIYDIRKEEVLATPIMATQLFPGWGQIVEFASHVLCTNCPPLVSDLVIAIGRPDIYSHHTFQTYRRQADGSLAKITGPQELPPDWGLRSGSGIFSLDAFPYWGFFPEEVVTLAINSSNFHGFTFFPTAQIFSLKYYNELGCQSNQSCRHFLYKKLLPNGSLTEWIDKGLIAGDVYSLNSMFYINDTLYAINNDPSLMPKISHKLTVEETNGKVIFRATDVNIDAREFFNCYDKQTSPPIPATIPIVPTTTTTATTTTGIANPIGSTNPLETTELSTTSESTTTTEDNNPTRSATEDHSTQSATEDHSTRSATEDHSTQSATEDHSTQSATEDHSTQSATEDHSTQSTPKENDDGDGIWFWIIFLILLLVIILILIVLCFGFLYFRKNREKGNTEYMESTQMSGKLAEDDMDDTEKAKQTISLGDSPSSMSVRSTRGHQKPNDIQNPDLIGSPSRASIRSIPGQQKPNEIENPHPIGSPSRATVRSFKN